MRGAKRRGGGVLNHSTTYYNNIIGWVAVDFGVTLPSSTGLPHVSEGGKGPTRLYYVRGLGILLMLL